MYSVRLKTSGLDHKVIGYLLRPQTKQTNRHFPQTFIQPSVVLKPKVLPPAGGCNALLHWPQFQVQELHSSVNISVTVSITIQQKKLSKRRNKERKETWKYKLSNMALNKVTSNLHWFYLFLPPVLSNRGTNQNLKKSPYQCLYTRSGSQRLNNTQQHKMNLFLYILNSLNACQ